MKKIPKSENDEKYAENSCYKCKFLIECIPVSR